VKIVENEHEQASQSGSHESSTNRSRLGSFSRRLVSQLGLADPVIAGER
jgi:hypothetical protein